MQLGQPSGMMMGDRVLDSMTSSQRTVVYTTFLVLISTKLLPLVSHLTSNGAVKRLIRPAGVSLLCGLCTDAISLHSRLLEAEFLGSGCGTTLMSGVSIRKAGHHFNLPPVNQWCPLTSSTDCTWWGVNTSKCCPWVYLEASLTNRAVAATACRQLGHSWATESGYFEKYATGLRSSVSFWIRIPSAIPDLLWTHV